MVAPILSTTIYGTWTETVELVSAIDDQPLNLDSITEITLQLIDQLNGYVWLTAKMSTGEIVIPAQGIIEWRIEVGAMRTFDAKVYQMLLLLEDDTDTVPLILGPVALVK